MSFQYHAAGTKQNLHSWHDCSFWKKPKNQTFQTHWVFGLLLWKLPHFSFFMVQIELLLKMSDLYWYPAKELEDREVRKWESISLSIKKHTVCQVLLSLDNALSQGYFIKMTNALINQNYLSVIVNICHECLGLKFHANQTNG